MRVTGTTICLTLLIPFMNCAAEVRVSDEAIRSSFKQHSIELDGASLNKVRPNVHLALNDFCAHRTSGVNSKVKFAAVEIASVLDLNPKIDSTVSERISNAITSLPCNQEYPRCLDGSHHARCAPNQPDRAWESYYDDTISLNNEASFLSLLNEKQFHPVKISWEDIGRYEDSVWGDRISDVGIWVRMYESDPSSAQLALSVRRDSNFRDKVLVVPSERIKIHVNENSSTREVALPDRLKELGLYSALRDNNVIVSNQFAIVPVPARTKNAGTPRGESPRAAFTFSIFPYGSTNFVITDVIEGSSNALVGPGDHQLLFANVGGMKAPFTASRAAERPDLLELEASLKSRGMDVDVQRYYLVQVPLKKGVSGITLSNMGTPPRRFRAMPFSLQEGAAGSPANGLSDSMLGKSTQSAERGLDKVAIGHGELEGPYSEGSGYRGMRSEEPVRVTVVYFVTPVGKVTSSDMANFTQAFESWDSSAIWGGSFVTKDN